MNYYRERKKERKKERSKEIKIAVTVIRIFIKHEGI
jgi:hypothetical protein